MQVVVDDIPLENKVRDLLVQLFLDDGQSYSMNYRYFEDIVSQYVVSAEAVIQLETLIIFRTILKHLKDTGFTELEDAHKAFRDYAVEHDICTAEEFNNPYDKT
jgi:hypothetical protein